MNNREDYLLRQIEYYQDKIRDCNFNIAEIERQKGNAYRRIARLENELLQIKRDKYA